jgi:endo-1,4-beta-xylanase
VLQQSKTPFSVQRDELPVVQLNFPKPFYSAIGKNMKPALNAFLSQIIVLLVVIRIASAGENASPVQGTPVFVAAKLADFRLGGQGPMADYSSIAVEGQAFTWAIRVRVADRTPNPWDVQILTPPATIPLKKGDHVLAIVNVRCTEAPDGVGRFFGCIQNSESPWTGISSTDLTAGKEWTRAYIHGVAEQDFAPGKYELTLHLGTQPQTLEFGGITMLNLGANVDENKLPFTPITYPGEESDAPWRKAAAERIEKYRKADLTVRVVDKAGMPVAGAKVHVQMQRHTYGFGTFLEYGVITGAGPDTDRLREWTLRMFNRCTTPIYWADWGWANPHVRQKYLECAKWAADNKLDTRGHCIIYPGWRYLPGFLKPLAGDPQTLCKQLLDHVAEVTEATKQFNFTEYDVTNELRDLKDIDGLLGRDAVVEWFKVARQHAPASSRMAINENSILTRGGMTQPQQDNYAGWIQYLIDQGQGPDVIGMQAHFGQTVTGPETVLHILDRFAKFGKPIQITEFDLPTSDEQGQAHYTRDFLTAVFSHPATDAFTMWGFWEGRMWQPPGAMIRKDWTLKPNGKAWMDLVFKEWWTDMNTTTGSDGSCTTRGFLGDYKITVTVGGRAKSALVKLTKPATTTVLALD